MSGVRRRSERNLSGYQVELRLHDPTGRRDEFVDMFESLVGHHMSMVRAAGCSVVTLYSVVDDPDKAVEIADWESADAREASQTNEEWRVFAPRFELVAAPPSATVVEPLH
jgi:quinol monooxygenase YgiN